MQTKEAKATRLVPLFSPVYKSLITLSGSIIMAKFYGTIPDILATPAYLGRYDANRNDPTCIVSLNVGKVGKAKGKGVIAVRNRGRKHHLKCRWPNCL